VVDLGPDTQNIESFEVSQPKYGCDHSLLRDRDPTTSAQAFTSCTSNSSRLNSVAQKLTVRMQQNMQQNSIRICYQALQTPPPDIDPVAWEGLYGAPLTNQSCVTCFMLNVINQPIWPIGYQISSETWTTSFGGCTFSGNYAGAPLVRTGSCPTQGGTLNLDSKGITSVPPDAFQGMTQMT
jgi:hypothetical protein